MIYMVNELEYNTKSK